jgi:hypothetical protein
VEQQLFFCNKYFLLLKEEINGFVFVFEEEMEINGGGEREKECQMEGLSNISQDR